MWREKYLTARRRGRIFVATTAVASAVAVGAVFWGISQQPDSSNDLASAVSGLAEGPGAREGVGPGGGSGLRGVPLEGLVDADGSVDTDAVEEIVATLPEGFDPTTIVERGLLRGTLSQDQADALLDAFAAASASGNGSA